MLQKRTVMKGTKQNTSKLLLFRVSFFSSNKNYNCIQTQNDACFNMFAFSSCSMVKLLHFFLSCITFIFCEYFYVKNNNLQYLWACFFLVLCRFLAVMLFILIIMAKNLWCCRHCVLTKVISATICSMCSCFIMQCLLAFVMLCNYYCCL